ncbi:pentatricopeptide repeat-containing protein At3g29230 isoform X2 [Daucus carota subsp. sativus]|uniref:pentatricopeptide repeat-containing protein At3g29230 isoform X2 n=1 Tax=Daucus carota subsp. sativus TaxID=79200 RepID=UPI003082A49B
MQRANSQTQQMLRVLQNCKTVKRLKQTHLRIIVTGRQGCNFIVPKLMNISLDLISLNYAVNVFRSSNNLNLITYNTLIKCFIGKSHEDALTIYSQMLSNYICPNTFTFTFLFKCFDSLESLNCGRLVHCHVIKMGFDSSLFVMNTVLGFYRKCCGDVGVCSKVFGQMPKSDVVSWNTMIGAYMDRGELELAVGLFEVMPERNIVTWNSVLTGTLKAGNMRVARLVFDKMPERNEVSWNAMVSGYVKLGHMEAAEGLFRMMPVKSVVSCTAIITGYTAVGNLEAARKMFDRMEEKNEVSWNAMIAGYVNNKMFDQALLLFQNMLVDGKCKPNQVTLTSVLSACTHLGSLEHGKWIDCYIKNNKIELSNPLGNALIDMFAKCGDLGNARVVFHKMRQRCIITWTTMITGLGVNGECREALELYYLMCLEGPKPDEVVFIAVLTACTHGGLVEEGKRVFDQMINVYNVTPQIEHYGCVVDLISRAGKLEEAVKFVDNMQLEPNAVIWATLLSACKIHRNGEMFEYVKSKILLEEPLNPGYLTLITNMSSSVERWQDALDVRMSMRQQGIEKVPGCSLIQIGQCAHEFLAKDTKHGHRKEIYQTLDNLTAHIMANRDILYKCSMDWFTDNFLCQQTTPIVSFTSSTLYLKVFARNNSSIKWIAELQHSDLASFIFRKTGAFSV